MPFAVPVFCFASAKDMLQAFGKQYGYKRAWQVLLGLTIAWIILFTSFTHQPQVLAFDLLKEPVNSLENRATLVTKHSDDIRKVGRCLKINQQKIILKEIVLFL